MPWTNAVLNKLDELDVAIKHEAPDKTLIGPKAIRLLQELKGLLGK